MVLEQFLVMLGVNADTEKVKSFGAALSKVAVIGTAVVGALKAVTVTAWAFADSYVRRAEELYKANDGLVQVTKEQVEMSKKYQEGMEKLGKTVEGVKTKIAFGFLPTMLELVDSFNKFLDANKDLIANGVTITLNAISKLSQVINNTVRFIDKIVSATIGWKAALFLIAAAFVYLKRAMLLAFVTNPVFWVIAAIGVLMLLIDDFMTYLDGGESQFGEFWGSMIEWIKENKETLLALKDTAIAVFEAIKEFFFTSIEALKNIIGGLGEYIGALVAFIVGIFTGNTDLIIDAWWGMVKAVFKIMKGLGIFILGVVDLILKTFGTSLSEIKGYFVEKFESIMDWLNFWYVTLKIWAGTLASIFTDKLESIKNAIIAPFAAAFDWIANKFGTLGGIIGGAVSGAKNLFSAGSNKNAFSAGGAAAASNSSVITGGNMTINAPISVSSNDPKRAGAAAGDSLNMLAGSAFRNMGTRVKA